MKLIQKLRNLKIKICGIKNTAILNCCNVLNVNYFGLVFYKKSPRYVDIKQACELIKHNNKAIPVGVFVNYNFEELIELISITNLNHIQLHGNESNDYIAKLKDKKNLNIIKAIGINSEEDLKKIETFSTADYLLFDYKSKNNELPGGNAKSFDWSIIKEKNIEKPWFISGGINKYNLNSLLDNLIPYGIDISSGVEEHPGIKNTDKIEEIVKIINDK